MMKLCSVSSYLWGKWFPWVTERLMWNMSHLRVRRLVDRERVRGVVRVYHLEDLLMYPNLETICFS